MNPQKKEITFNDGIKIIKASFLAFPKVWWRIALINLTTVFIIVLGFLLFGSFLFWGIGAQTIQNIFINFGVTPTASFELLKPYLLLIGGVFFLLFSWIIAFGVAGKIAGILTIKDYVKKKKTNPFILYFVKSWNYFWLYLGGSLRVFWYIFWPSLCISLLFLFCPFLLEKKILILLIFIFFVWRIFNSIFTIPFIIHSKKSISKSFESGLKIVKGNFWIIFVSLLFLILLFSCFGWSIELFEYYLSLQKNINHASFILGFKILDFLINFFIFTPIMISFVYFLMVHIAKIKNIK